MVERKIGIYCIRNIITRKCYIGQSDNIHIRWKRHKAALKRRTANPKLQKDWDEYGEQNFVFEILEETEYNQYILDERESYFAYKLNVWDNGYNVGRLLDYQCISKSEISQKKIELLELLSPHQGKIVKFQDVCLKLKISTDALSIVFKNIDDNEMQEKGIYLKLNCSYSYQSDIAVIEIKSWTDHLKYQDELNNIYKTL